MKRKTKWCENMYATAGTFPGTNETGFRLVLYSDHLMQKHLLALNVRGDIPVLVDTNTAKPASRDRVKKYLQELKTHPGFPGPEITRLLAEQTFGKRKP